MSLRPDPAGSNCASCGALFDAEQRYCLECGALVAARRVDPLLALGFPEDQALAGEPGARAASAPLGDGAFAAPAAADPAVLAGAEPARSGAGPARRTPSPRLAAALAAAALVVGCVAGAALGPTPDDSVAATPARQVVALVVPQAATPAAATPTTTTARPPATPRHSASTPTAAPSSGDDTASPSSVDDSDTSAPSTATTRTTTAKTGDSTSSGDDDASSSTPSATTVAGTAPAHVWLIALPQGVDPNILTPLAPQGTLLSGYAAAGPSAAVDGVALLGGQVPTADCSADATPCVLAAGETSLPDQLTAVNLTWKAYVEDATLRCAAPSALVATSLFTTLRDRRDCTTTTVGTDALAADLKDIDKTPALSLIVPQDPATALAPLVARITASDAYKKDGVVVIVPDAPPPGALVIAPSATAGATNAAATGPVALLRSLDGLFGLDPLATAAQAPAGALDGVLATTTSTPSTSTPSTTTTSTTRRSP
jgi:hypothetical protein